MVFIWENYEQKMERQHAGITRTKDFKYPPIVPIVFYDGDGNWTAATRLHERVLLSDILWEFIPDYRCILMQLKDYSNEEVMAKKNELSVLMLIDKLKNEADFAEMTEAADQSYLSEATGRASEALLGIMTQVMSILLEKINVSQKEAEAFIGNIKEKKMGELLANFKGWDIQAARRELQEARDELKEAREKTREEDIGKSIRMLKAVLATKDTVKEQLMEQYGLDEAEAGRKISLYW